MLPALGSWKLPEISRSDVARFHQSMKAKPGAANRCLALLSKMFNLAEKWGLRADGSNPTRHVEKYRERKLERFLSNEELALLGAVLRDAESAGENKSVIAAIRLLIFTGCRRDEILKLQWQHVDLDAKCLRLPDSKTGAKLVPLGAPAIAVLTGLSKKEGNPYVLPGLVKGQHYVGLEKAWRRLREQATLELWRKDATASAILAELKKEHPKKPVTCSEVWTIARKREVRLHMGMLNVRLHDLRHSFASVAAGMGESLALIGSILGHLDTATTARYAHLSNDPRQAAADRVSQRIAGAMGTKSAVVVSISQKAAGGRGSNKTVRSVRTSESA